MTEQEHRVVGSKGGCRVSFGALVAFVLGFLCPLFGTTTSLEEAFDLEAVVVEGSRFGVEVFESPTGISVVNAAEIHRAGLQVTLAESLGLTPGVFVLNPDNYAQDTRIAIRGFGARADFGIRGIRVYADGLPLTTPDGQGEVDSIDLGSTARISVIRGPAAALYGAAAGGVIHLFSEEGTGPGYAETRLTLGETGLSQFQLKAGEGGQGLRRFISMAYLEREGFRDHSETRQFRLNGNVVIQPRPGHRMKWVFNYIDFPLQNDPGGLTLAEYRARPSMARDRNVAYDAGESVRQYRLGLSYEWAGEGDAVWSATLFHAHRDFANRLPFESGGQVGFGRDFSGGSVLFRKEGEVFRVQSGIDLHVQQDARSNFDNQRGLRGPLALRQDEEVQAAGFYAYGVGRLSSGGVIHGGLRADEIRFVVRDRFLADGNDSGRLAFDAVSPFLGWRRPLGLDAVLFLNLSKAFETPTTTEFDNPAGGGFNSELRAQEAIAWEAGWRRHLALAMGSVDLEAALFLIEERDGLVPYELEAFPGREFYRNAARSTRKGLELGAVASLDKRWSLSAHLTVSDFRYARYSRDGLDLAGNRLPGIPRAFGAVALGHEAESGFWVHLEGRYAGSLFANDTNTTSVEPHFVADLKWGWRSTSGQWEWEPFFAISNLFDRRYAANVRINAAFDRFYEGAPERFFYLGLRLRAAPYP